MRLTFNEIHGDTVRDEDLMSSEVNERDGEKRTSQAMFLDLPTLGNRVFRLETLYEN
ncbi:MAG TPA: hypothetical protein VMI32_12565 [Candidatus Solibacter sp.]|nr:hypothetical protein [Candidatus Solibacter sp.]